MDVHANGIGFRCRIDGPDGAPWLTFSNSLATTLEMWDPQAAAFGGTYRVLRYDMRGHGGTTVTAPPYGLGLLASDVVALWDALGITRSHFVGLSVGGATGIGLVLGHPERVISAAICDARCQSSPTHKTGWFERVERAQAGGMAAIAEPLLAGWFTEAGHRAGLPAIDTVRGMILATPFAGFLGGVHAVAGANYEARLGEIGTPMLFLCGRQDIGDFPDQARRMHAAVAGSRLEFLDGAAHLSNLEQPAAFNSALGAFLDASSR